MEDLDGRSLGDLWYDIYSTLRQIEGDYVVHKLKGEVYVFPVIAREGPELFIKLHAKHEDIIHKIIRYGNFLLKQRLGARNFTVVKD